MNRYEDLLKIYYSSDEIHKKDIIDFIKEYRYLSSEFFALLREGNLVQSKKLKMINRLFGKFNYKFYYCYEHFGDKFICLTHFLLTSCELQYRKNQNQYEIYGIWFS